MTGSKPNYGYRENPQLSANQMAEYLSATPGRRKSIIREARFPKTSQAAQYDGARRCLVDFLADNSRSHNHISHALNRLEKREARPGATDWVKRDCRFSTEAIEAFQRSYNRSGLVQLQCEAPRSRLPLLPFGPTKISVSLNLITRRKNLGGRDAIGGVIFVFARGEASSKKRVERCKVIAGLVYDFALKHLSKMGEADTAICHGFDVFGQKAYPPPGTFARKRQQIADSCEEIGIRWWTVDPPPDYDGPDF